MAERIKAATPGAASGKRRKNVYDLSVRREGGEEGAGGGGAESGVERRGVPGGLRSSQRVNSLKVD